MSDTEVGGLDRAGRLALASPYSRREWGLALEIMGSRADELLPTVQELSAIGWAPSAAASTAVGRRCASIWPPTRAPMPSTAATALGPPDR